MASSEGSSPLPPTTTEPETNLESKPDTTLDSNVESETPVTDAKDGEEEEGSGKTLEEAAELMEKGSTAIKDADYAEAAECFSRAVEIRVGHYGELAPECSSAYYKYGCALLYKAQEEADPLGSMPKKDAAEKNGPVSKGESSASSAVGDANHNEDSTRTDADPNDEVKDANETAADDEDADEGSDDEDEDESDLDLSWKMLDLARAIVEKNPEDTLEKVDILSALGEVALEREDIETSLSDYSSALSIVERLVEADSRRIAELNFRICVVLEVSSKPAEAIPYCQKAISVCRSRVQRLKDEANVTKSAPTEVANGEQKADQGPDVSDKEAEIETLSGLMSDLEKKLEDLQQLVSQPNTFVSDFLKMIAAKSAAGNGTSSSASAFDSSQLGTNSGGGSFDSPTLSTAHTTGSGDGGAAVVQHLGVVGRGVKRVSTSSVEPVSVKKPALEKGKEAAP